ncbi:MAG: serine/threonine-protein kinase [Acidobacteriota bacterium]
MSSAADDWKRTRAIFDLAIAASGDARTAIIERECGGDRDLERSVRQLLEAHDRADTFLETPARILVDRLEPGPDAMIGAQLGAYLIESRLGAGGMGEVYLARDTKLNRPVALKLLSNPVVDAERFRRFRQEAYSVSALNHPNILVIHDVGEEDGRPYMVTEYVEGQTLRARMQSPLPLASAIDLALQVAQALAAAHARGIVHRDVKPENVMVRPDGYVKVLDFGLAKLSDVAAPPDGRSAPHTTPGAVMGTPQYMSPEQARGLDLDARSDVWSLAAMVYEMIAGAPPFAGATSADLISSILNTEPVPLELRAPHVSPAVSRLIARALRKNRLERPAHAGDFVTELAALAPESGDTLRATTISEIGNEDGSTPRTRVTKRTRIVVLPFRMLRPDPDIDFLGFSLADAIATTLSSLDSLIVRSSLAAMRFATERPDLRALAAEAEVDVVLVGTLLRAGSQLRVSAQLLGVPEGTIKWSDRIDVAADDLIRIQDEITERIVDSLSLPLASHDQQLLHHDVPASARAYELYLRGNTFFYSPDQWPIARDLYIECVAEDPAYAPAWARL